MTTWEDIIKTRRWAEVVTAISSILTLIIAVFSSRVPSWFIYIPIGFLVISVLVLVWNPVATFFRKKLENRRYNQSANYTFREFRDFTQRFGEFVDSNISSNLIAHLQNLQGHDEIRYRLTLLPLPIIESFFHIFKERVEGFNKDYKSLSLLAKDFNSIMRFHHYSYVIEPLQPLRQINLEAISKEKIGEIELWRENYCAFLRDYLNYAKRINEHFGQTIFVEYYEMPKTLR